MSFQFHFLLPGFNSAFFRISRLRWRMSKYFAHSGHNLWTNTSAENRASNFSVEQFPLPVTLNLFSITDAWANRWKCNYTQAALTLQAWWKEIYGGEWAVLRIHHPVIGVIKAVLQASSTRIPWTEVEAGMPWLHPGERFYSLLFTPQLPSDENHRTEDGGNCTICFKSAFPIQIKMQTKSYKLCYEPSAHN